MAFEKLLNFTKDVSDLADIPSLTPTELKAQFDAAPDEVRVYLNKLIDALLKTAAGDSGAKNVGASTISGLTGSNVQTLLEAINTAKLNLTGGTITGNLNIVGNLSENGFGVSAVTEFGSNGSGHYIRYDNGVQECWYNIEPTDQAINVAYGTLFLGTRLWTFPKPFLGTPLPSVHCSNFQWGTGASWGSVVGQPSATTVTLRGMDILSRAAGTPVYISAYAVGIWK